MVPWPLKVTTPPVCAVVVVRLIAELIVVTVGTTVTVPPVLVFEQPGANTIIERAKKQMEISLRGEVFIYLEKTTA